MSYLEILQHMHMLCTPQYMIHTQLTSRRVLLGLPTVWCVCAGKQAHIDNATHHMRSFPSTLERPGILYLGDEG
jgi:hypothetical protein